MRIPFLSSTPRGTDDTSWAAAVAPAPDPVGERRAFDADLAALAAREYAARHAAEMAASEIVALRAERIARAAAGAPPDEVLALGELLRALEDQHQLAAGVAGSLATELEPMQRRLRQYQQQDAETRYTTALAHAKATQGANIAALRAFVAETLPAVRAQMDAANPALAVAARAAASFDPSPSVSRDGYPPVQLVANGRFVELNAVEGGPEVELLWALQRFAVQDASRQDRERLYPAA